MTTRTVDPETISDDEEQHGYTCPDCQAEFWTAAPLDDDGPTYCDRCEEIRHDRWQHTLDWYAARRAEGAPTP